MITAALICQKIRLQGQTAPRLLEPQLIRPPVTSQAAQFVDLASGFNASSGMIRCVSQLFPLSLPPDPHVTGSIPPLAPRLHAGAEPTAEQTFPQLAPALPGTPAPRLRLVTDDQLPTRRQLAKTRRRAPLDPLALLPTTSWAIASLRICLGLVFLFFGALKFIPGASPAEALVQQTVGALTFGLITGQSAVFLTAAIECIIGFTLITRIFLKAGLIVLGGAFLGIMAPLVLFFDELFPFYPTIVGQYVLKDIVLVAAGLVIAASELRADS